MKKIITIGKPTHLQRLNGTACGITSELKCYDPRDVDCLRCLKTKYFKNKFDGKVVSDENKK